MSTQLHLGIQVLHAAWRSWRAFCSHQAAKRARAQRAAAYLALQLLHSAFDAWREGLEHYAAERRALQRADAWSRRRWLHQARVHILCVQQDPGVERVAKFMVRSQGEV